MSKKLTGIIIILLTIVVLAGLLFINLSSKTPELDKNSEYLVIRKDNLIAVYKDKLAVMIPLDIHIDKNTTFRDVVENKSSEEVLAITNRILPEPLSNHVNIKYGKLNINAKNKKNIPEITIDNKRFILTSSMYSMYEQLYNERNNKNELNENIIVDVLNANGINGYARRTGENIKKKFGMKYNAANYESNLEESYVILNDIAVEKVEELIMELDEKYFKIQQVPTIPTLANVVIVLGKEENLDFKIEVVGAKTNEAENCKKELLSKGYKNIEIAKNEIVVDKNVIEYSDEDYFIAYKLSKILNINNLIKRDGLKNKIRIILN